ncbi:hypothetical protein AA105894_2512 [Asaia spathodeae NBRC 105894]|nr:hypothetical protein AA105894_2512 [Asaia spathodeae NBRC 105894]
MLILTGLISIEVGDSMNLGEIAALVELLVDFPRTASWPLFSGRHAKLRKKRSFGSEHHAP